MPFMTNETAAMDARCRGQIAACLRVCGLSHWHALLMRWLDRYAGLEDLVDEERHAPCAAMLTLLRTMVRVEAKPSDACFAALLARLEFLDYRVRRSTVPGRFLFEDGETWNPEASRLLQWAEERPLGAWRAGTSPRSREAIAQELLRALRAGHEPRT